MLIGLLKSDLTNHFQLEFSKYLPISHGVLEFKGDNFSVARTEASEVNTKGSVETVYVSHKINLLHGEYILFIAAKTEQCA